jgi:PiT family inorganic phosphate transporter
MLTIILFAVGAWYFGIPTSESHALIAALAASSFAAAGRMDTSGWDLVMMGLLMSLIFGLFFGMALAKLLTRPLERFSKRTLSGAKIAGAAASAFMHGAQDGQKFIAVLILAEIVSSGRQAEEAITISGHIPALFICALAMSLGTAMGGRRIIHNIGVKMVPMDRSQGICSDIGSAICLLLATLAGIPMSTTHAKTSAIMGAGIGSGSKVNTGVIGSMIVAWIITFPVCAVLGYLLTKLFIR